MDSDMWISRLAAVKRQYVFHQQQKQQQSSVLDRLSVEDYEVEGEQLHQDFPCPYCYEDHDQSSLCAHLEDEHPFEAGVTACPICSVKVAGDLLNHITTQHKHQFKIQKGRPLRRVAIPSGQVLSLLGRDLREAHLQLLLASGLQSSNNDAPASVPDSLLSSLVLNFPTSETEEISKPTIPIAEDTSKSSLTSKTSKYCSEPSLTSEEREQKAKQAAVRASFVQGWEQLRNEELHTKPRYGVPNCSFSGRLFSTCRLFCLYV